MTKRIFRGIALTALVTALLVSVAVTLTLYRATEMRLMEELHAEAGYILHALTRESDDVAYFAGFTSENRVTLVSSSGVVLYDSTIDASMLDNHADRPEIAGALAVGNGESRRYSDTLALKTLYYAAKTDDGNVLRVSNSVNSVWSMLADTVYLLLAILVIVSMLALLVARRIARRIVSPINSLDLNDPLSNAVYDELSPLLRNMDRQNRAIAAQIAQLADKQKELAAIAGNMREGLVLLDAAGNVLSINGSAAHIFGVDGEKRIGSDLLTVTRDAAVAAAVGSALAGKSADAVFARAERYYQAFANPVAAESGKSAGAVLLLLDITERYAAEISRREFTANVSHELKTPLTSISGYAEIMRDGVARPEDTQRFCARIYDEANRLIALVNDILALSRLDEQRGLGEKTGILLLSLVSDVLCRLAPAAEEKGIALSSAGENAVVCGYPALLDEMLFNLVDNAVKYTPPGGSVRVEVRRDGERTSVCVTDTGIGIPLEDQPHVFERFYRVDKSHSKATGGTGLGLSIVKHGAAVHGARILLKSELGRGTSVQITF